MRFVPDPLWTLGLLARTSSEVPAVPDYVLDSGSSQFSMSWQGDLESTESELIHI